MINLYDLYDLHAILIAICSNPNDSFNSEVVLNIINVINDRGASEINQIRKSLQTIKSLIKNDIYDFVFVENKYSYYPLPFLKDEKIYAVLFSSLREILVALNEKDEERTFDLADCLHNLPIMIVENNYSIPKIFWKKIVKDYRRKWNNNFLRIEEKGKC